MPCDIAVNVLIVLPVLGTNDLQLWRLNVHEFHGDQSFLLVGTKLISDGIKRLHLGGDGAELEADTHPLV